MVNVDKYTSPMDFIGNIPLDWLVTVKIPSLKKQLVVDPRANVLGVTPILTSATLRFN